MKKANLAFLFVLLLPAVLPAQQLAPSIVWQKCLGGSGSDLARSLIYTPDHGMIIVGSSTSNDGDVSGHHGPLTTTDAWVVKLSALGDIEWQRSLGGKKNDEFIGVRLATDGGYLCIGNTTSADGDVSGYHSDTSSVAPDIWVVKLDRYGNIVWQKCLGGSGNEYASNIRQNKDGSIYVIGQTGSSDGDVMGDKGAYDSWVVKLDKNGTMLWQKCFGGTQEDKGYDIIEAENGSFIMLSEINSTDAGFGSFTITPHGIIAKIDSNRNTIWYQVLTRRAPTQITNPSGNDYFVSANYNGSLNCGYSQPAAYEDKFTDVPFGTTPPVISEHPFIGLCSYLRTATTGYSAGGNSNLSNTEGSNVIYALTTGDSTSVTGFHGGEYDGFITGMRKNNQNTSWKKLIGGSGRDDLFSAASLNEFEFAVAGFTDSKNGDVSGNHGGQDAWVVKLGQVNNIKGIVFLDYNLNGSRDINEPLLNNIIVQSQKDSTKAASSTYNGYFSNFVDTGTYITKVLTSVPYYTVSPVSKSSLFINYNTSDSFSFAMQPVPGKRDYLVSLFPAGLVRPRFAQTYNITCVNVGTDTLVNKNVRMIKDSRLQFLSASPVQTSISGDTINWLINRLAPRDTAMITVQVLALPPPALNVGDVVRNSVLIDSTGDLTPLNNFAQFTQGAFGSIDPNDKEESAGGSFSTKDISDSKYLQYTIRFQNTGNDSAFTVLVKDTLDAKTDWSSIEMVTASHPYQLNIKDGRYCTWQFNNIKLVDSTHNEPGSHGYLVYRLKPASTLHAGDSIINSASIYFDFNPGIKTNTQLTIVKPDSVQTPVVTGLQDNYCSNLGIQKGKIINLPPAADGTTVTIKLDAVVLPLAADSAFNISPAALSAGNHLIAVTFKNSSDSKTSTINFSVTQAVMPIVHLTANITTAVNLTDPVIITATNTAGGGASPTYTFAKDRSFTSVLQAESNANTVTIQPNTLTIGTNWIYIRMKTSDTCYTSQTNTDSIDIERSAITGLTDVDFPNQVITIYPNPFSHVINITGLNQGKIYTISISNAAGQKLFSLQATNRQTLSIDRIGLQSGTYWLSIYDYKKHTLLGTVPVIKE